MTEFKYEVGMYIETCISCGVHFAVPIKYMEERKGDHKSFCCPNGHRQYYPQQTEGEILKRKLNSAKNRLDTCQIRSKALDYRARYYKGKVTKIQKVQEATGG